MNRKNDKCNFDVRKSINNEGLVQACDCGGAVDIKGKGFMAEVIKQKLSVIGRATGEVLAEIAESIFYGIGRGTTPSSIAHRAKGLTDAVSSIATVAESGDYADFNLELHPCIKDSWSKATKINVNWNGLGSIKEVEGLKLVKEITAKYNNISNIPDLNTLPSLQKLDLQWNKIPHFKCDSKKFIVMNFDKKKIDQLRSCQAKGTLFYGTRKSLDDRFEDFANKLDESGITEKINKVVDLFPQ